MASILDKYGIKEVADVVFYELDSKGAPSAPVLYLDTLKVSTIEQSAEVVDATGGKGNVKLDLFVFKNCLCGKCGYVKRNLVDLLNVSVIAEEGIFLSVDENAACDIVFRSRPMLRFSVVKNFVGRPYRKIRVNGNKRNSRCSEFHIDSPLFCIS